MKKILIAILFLMLLIAPQSSNADTLPMNLSLSKNNAYVYAGDIFSVTLNINIDYSRYASSYSSGFYVDWGAGTCEIKFLYDHSIVKLLNSGGDFYGSEESGTQGLAGTTILYHSSYVLNFQSLKSGNTNLGISGGAFGDLWYYDPGNQSAFQDGWVLEMGNAFTEGSTMHTINVSTNNVPEPATLLLLGLGLFGVTCIRRNIKIIRM